MRSLDVLPAIRSALRANTPEEITALRSLPYTHYLHSEWWRWRRNQKLREARYRCERCGDNRQVQVHHLTYDRLGAEESSDLEALCRDCHLGEHFNATQTYINLYVRLLSGVLAEGTRVDFADILEEGKVLCARYELPYRPSEFHAAVSRLLPRMPFTPPPGKRPLFDRSAPGDPPTPGEAAAALSWVKQSGALKPMPAVSLDEVCDSMTYVEAIMDSRGGEDAAAHEAAVWHAATVNEVRTDARAWKQSSPCPRCPYCGDYALLGAKTCGHPSCMEATRRCER